MSAISEFADKFDAAMLRMEASLNGIKADIQALKNNPGDLAILDRLSAKVDSMATEMETLDSENP